MAQLTWAELDALPTAEAIADKLRALGIKGKAQDPSCCPLAVATGYRVYATSRVKYADEAKARSFLVREERSLLTDAEKAFIAHGDAGGYPDICEMPPKNDF